MINVPRVSVIIAAYNAADTLNETLASVAAQTYRDFEVVVVDDGSTDATPELLATYAARWPWMRWARQDNAGAAAARNHAVAMAQGEFIAFLDADDLWLPEKLAEQMALFERDPATALVYSDMVEFPETSRTMKGTLFQLKPPARGMILRQFFMGNFILTSTVVVRKSALESVGGFNPSFKVVEDVDLLLRLAEHHRFDYVDKVLVKYRVRPNSLGRLNSLDNQTGDLKIFDYWVARRPDLFPENSSHVRQRRATVYARMGDTLLSRHHFKAARSAYRHAIAFGQRDPRVLARAAAAHVPAAAKLFWAMKSATRRLR